jgi:hypothetical protein
MTTSRGESDIHLEFATWDFPHLIDKGKVVDDIRLFVASEINRNPRLSVQPIATKDQIKTRLVEDGNGM